MFRLQSEIRGEQTGLIDEMIGNQKVVQAFGRGEDATERFDEVNKKIAGGILAGNIFSHPSRTRRHDLLTVWFTQELELPEHLQLYAVQ